MEEADEVLDLLVRHHPADKQDVGPLVIVHARDGAVGGAVEMQEIWHDRQDPRPLETQRFEVLAIEFRITERDVAAFRIRSQLTAAAEAFAAQRSMQTDKEFRRGNVVINERHPIGQRKRRAGGLRRQREVVQQQIVGVAVVDEVPVVDRHRLEPWVGGLDEDLRFITGRAKDPLNAEYLVADGIAVAQRGKHLMDSSHDAVLAISAAWLRRVRRPPG